MQWLLAEFLAMHRAVVGTMLCKEIGMLQQVDVGERALRDYRGVAPDAILDEVVAQAEQLRGARVLHVNATP